MTFRLMNFGRRLVWESDEYMYHTWHPGSDGTMDYFGPHDGLQMSATAFQALNAARVRPLVENEAIRRLRTGEGEAAPEALVASLVNPAYVDLFDRVRLGGSGTKPALPPRPPAPPKELWASYRGYEVYLIHDKFYGVPVQMGTVDPADPSWLNDSRVVQDDTFSAIQPEMEIWESRPLEETAGGTV